MLFVFYAVFRLMQEKAVDFKKIQAQLAVLKVPKNIFLLSLILFLTPINWAFEAIKWKKMANKVEKISFWQAYRAVLIGLTLSIATPIGIGDYAGKMLLLKSEKRFQSIGAVFLGNSVQLYVSLTFGMFSYLFFIVSAKPTFIYLHIFLLFILVLCVLLGIYLASNLYRINAVLENRYIKLIKPFFNIIASFQAKEIKELFFLSVARYCVFSFQFLLMFFIFDSHLGIPILLAGIGFVFLTKTLISVINVFADLGIRELSSIYFFGFFGANLTAISTATFMIWLINVFLPIIVGSVFILQIKLSFKTS